MSTEINNYISKRYKYWKNYADFHCSCAGIPNESIDVLNEVLLSLLKKNEQQLLDLYNAKKNQYCELDFYILKSIKLNASSPTSPYQSKYKPIPSDTNVDYSTLEIEDQGSDDSDRSGYILERMHEIRLTIEELGFSEKAMSVFEFRFFNDGIFKEWDGDESTKELYDLYSRIIKVLRKKIKGELIF